MLSRVGRFRSDLCLVKGLAKYIRYNEVSLYLGSFSYILLVLGRTMSFVTPSYIHVRYIEVPLYLFLSKEILSEKKLVTCKHSALKLEKY